MTNSQNKEVVSNNTSLEKPVPRGTVHFLAFCQRRLSWFFLPVLAGLFFVGALLWARGCDPFWRIWFEVGATGQGKTECVAVLPKMAYNPGTGKMPVVIYLHGKTGNILGSGNELRQLAEMGVAAVGMNYDQTNEVRCEAQVAALLTRIQHEPWADTNRIVWIGYSLGAQRFLTFLLHHPEDHPKLFIQLGGGSIPEMDHLKFQALQPNFSVLLVHGGVDDTFPTAEARRVAQYFSTNGVRTEISILPQVGHDLGGNGLQIFRVLGEYCLTHLNGAEALRNYRSILSWQTRAWPLWIYWLPAAAWMLGWGISSRTRRRRIAQMAGPDKECAAKNPPASPVVIPNAPLKPSKRWWDLGLYSVAVILAVTALGQTALHLIPPWLPIGPGLLDTARKHLVAAKEREDFEYLCAKPFWQGKRLRTLLDHVELAHYTVYELINWKLEAGEYQDYVLSPEIAPEFDGDLDWRRELWENFYPRIRKEQSIADAALIVAQFLRERVTIAEGNEFDATIEQAWERQITNERGFEALYVAAMRSAGIPARLTRQGKAEFWDKLDWHLAPRPILEYTFPVSAK